MFKVYILKANRKRIKNLRFRNRKICFLICCDDVSVQTRPTRKWSQCACSDDHQLEEHGRGWAASEQPQLRNIIQVRGWWWPVSRWPRRPWDLVTRWHQCVCSDQWSHEQTSVSGHLLSHPSGWIISLTNIFALLFCAWGGEGETKEFSTSTVLIVGWCEFIGSIM